ncbi:MAG: nucleoside hydrolase [Bacteroidetes bacterium]|nr:nucleoside hydrolase [Bacteroidota bacterium]
MNKKRVIIDCDNTMGLPDWEVDDGLVLLYLLGRDDIDILGITNTFGNGSLRDVVHYTEQVLKDIGRTDIPRFSGESFAGQNPQLILEIRAGNRYENELDTQEFPSDAARFLVEQVNKYPGEISILALGPAGNLYDAWKLDNDFYQKTKEIVLMGGYTEDLYIGEINCRELNLSCNPEAAYSMLKAECPVVVFNGHICLQAPFKIQDMNRIAYWPEERQKIVRDWHTKFSNHFSGDAFYLWDLLPAVYISYPELFDLKQILICPTVKSLQCGMLQPVSAEEEKLGNLDGVVTIIMPDNILDQKRFMDIMESGWRKEWERESHGWE